MKNVGRRHFMTGFVAPLFFLWSFLWSSLSAAQPINFTGSYSNINGIVSEDPTKPVSSGRSYFTTEIVPIDATKAKLIVHIRHGELNSPVSLSLQAAINSGVPGAQDPVQPIHIDLISDKVSDNPNLYYSRREFILDYADLTQKLRANLGPNAQHITIGSGSALFVFGFWHNYHHSWGSVGRGGLIYLPESKSAANSAQVISARGRAQSLDIAYPITNIMALQYNTMDGTQQKGLKVGGNIASRLEMEGKYQVPLDQADQVLKNLFELANDSNKAASVLGPDWTIEAEMRYMRKDASGNLLKDSRGLPIPDPMVDTYYDSLDSKGAEKDFAFRYRWTEGNKTGGWNFKPGMTEVRPSGVVYRLEYAVDTTDDRPETIKRFADSDSPLNPFREIRNQFAGAQPSSFLNQSLRISDQRYKFKLKNKSGLVVEVSLDYVDAESLRNGRKARFVQLEMDVDHPSTSRSNRAIGLSEWAGLTLKLDAGMQRFAASLDQRSFLDGRPVIHILDDVKSESPIQQKFLSDFDAAEKMIVALRDYTLGPNWLMAPQKASMAAMALKHITSRNASPSVRRLFAQAEQKGISTSRLVNSFSGQMMCKSVHSN